MKGCLHQAVHQAENVKRVSCAVMVEPESEAPVDIEPPPPVANERDTPASARSPALCDVCDDTAAPHGATHKCEDCLEFAHMCLLHISSHMNSRATKSHRLTDLRPPPPLASAPVSAPVSARASAPPSARLSMPPPVASIPDPQCLRHQQPYVFFDRECHVLLCMVRQVMVDMGVMISCREGSRERERGGWGVLVLLLQCECE
jgi:hypothetical protein